ncbi:MAG: GNAT family N-acetyltransferase [Phenylobacterium sp.]|uniref:GNAT family N-acetyltransferase n=1 Tax=Phenylobacterium sp. TaxID=1871053 RepID=UPI002715B071|nr:GNAT family N-acetyltransferase [Phenylobacterium sp.]MDO8911445.1 GNAT family N-acetyltransferase [Phenylobacterium sp.]MDO9249087.1 GNAT family N-acetyltransferase [Phenylobacterium sp.]MDP2011515.1 GNAT family N-acetyltransferase [Phenylobacterium sp.]MDP3098905.1 GNAT family N-acetyltransferase [Phenylobacterium sp.]HQT52316.1 GNAT family N-acetyltransferase [Phenylobacterium sp.]
MASRYGLEIRAADSVDAPGITELLQAAGLLAAAALAARLERLKAERATILLAIEWGPPSGLIVFHARQTLLADLPCAFVSTLVVGPDARRRGIGRLLLKAASQAARSAGCGELHISVPEGQAGLRAFCQATGFDEQDAGFVRPLRKRN